MKFIIDNLKENPFNHLRRLGYGLAPDRTSLVKRLTNLAYPRFHVYIIDLGANKYEISLHLDQKKPTYQGQRAHSGEYGGHILEQEKDFILNGLKQ